MTTKEIKSIDLASYTTIVTGISVMFAILSSIIISIGLYIINPVTISLIKYLVPTVIIGTLMYGIYHNFLDGFLYNALTKVTNGIKLDIDGDQITKISVTETAILVSIIITIEAILVYLVSMLIVPLLLNALMEIFMYSGQMMLALTLYQIMAIISQPTIIGTFLLGTFVMSFVFTVLGAFIYNLLGKNGRGISLDLSEENGMTIINSVNILKFAICLAIISGVLNIIIAILTIISGASAANIIGNIIGGFISGFVEGALFALFYNLLAPRLGKLKLELID